MNKEAFMVGPIDVNRRNWDERATIHARDTTGDYMLDRFRAGEDALHAIEAAELGDISGKRVLHLQCHIGRDTLCLVRRGAVATTYHNAGVRVFDIEDPFQPREAGFFVPPDPERMFDPRPNRPKVIQSADCFVDAQGVMYLTDNNAGLYVLQFEGA